MFLAHCQDMRSFVKQSLFAMLRITRNVRRKFQSSLHCCCINMSWCACPLRPPVTQTIPLPKESRESLVYIHVCVFEILGKIGLW